MTEETTSSCSNIQNEDVIPTEREIRELRRNFNKLASHFSNLMKQTAEIEFCEIDNCYQEITSYVDELMLKLESVIKSTNEVDNSEKFEDYTDKKESLMNQYQLIQNIFAEAEKMNTKRLYELEKSLKSTSSKNTGTGTRSKVSTSKHSKYFGSLFSNKSTLSYRQKALVAESQAQIAQVKANLYNKLANTEQAQTDAAKAADSQQANLNAVNSPYVSCNNDNADVNVDCQMLNCDGDLSHGGSKAKRVGHGVLGSGEETVKKFVVGSAAAKGPDCHHNRCSDVDVVKCPCRPIDAKVETGSKVVNVDNAESLELRSRLTPSCTYNDVSHNSNEPELKNLFNAPKMVDGFDKLLKVVPGNSIGDNYLAGKILMDSGSKVSFDGNPKDYTAFRQGMNRVVSMYGSQFGLIFDILQSRCKGKALEAIKCCDRIADPERALQTALLKLEKFFGSEIQIIESHLAHLTRNEPVKWNIGAFQDFINELEEVKLMVDNAHFEMLNSPGVIKKIAGRLPKHTRDKLTQQLCSRGLNLPTFKYLFHFVEDQLDFVSHPLMQNEKPVAGTSNLNRLKAVSNLQKTTEFKCPVIGCSRTESHPLWTCEKYKQLPCRDKWVVAKKSSRCYKCLNTGHMQDKCTFNRSCGICRNQRHHTLLCQQDAHSENSRGNTARTDSGGRNTDARPARLTTEYVNNHCALLDGERKLLPVIPVVASNRETGKSVTVNCLLDSGSDTTMCTKHLAKLLCAEPKQKVDVQLMTSNAETKETAYKIDVSIQGVNDKHGYRYNLNNVTCLNQVARHNNPVSVEFVKLTDVTNLKDLDIPTIKDEKIDLLIGNDYEELLDIMEIRRSSEYRIAAKLSKFGWLLVGNTGQRHDAKVNVEESMSCELAHLHRVTVSEDSQIGSCTPCSGNINDCKLLHEEIERYIAADVSYQDDDEDSAPAVNDLRCTAIYTKSACKKDGRYFLDLPMKDDVYLANNKDQAISRLMQQRKSLMRNPELKKFYIEAIQQLLSSDKLELVDEENETVSGRVFNIPHFATKQKKKRIVYDASARYEGCSLNDVLYQGEDDLQRLVDVILRFRRYPVAFCADIKEMFLQCGINEVDRDLLHILWFKDHDLNGSIETYRFKRLPYGLNCSMSMANFCLKKTLCENETNASPDTIALSKECFYVDDCLVCCKNTEIAKRTVDEMTDLLKSGGFELRKFVSNDDSILCNLDQTKLLPQSVQDGFMLCDNADHKVLGLRWQTQDDVLAPTIDIKERPATKRGLWATIAQVFDPIGICAPFLLTGRRLLQEILTEFSDWDEPIPESYRKKWDNWVKSLFNLEKLKIQRCYWSVDVDRYELHTYCDSSEYGMGCVAYLKMTKGNEIRVAFIMGKSKVIPKNSTMSIPKLELIAAVLGARMHRHIKDSIHLPLVSCYLYSDSTVVLDWLRNVDRRHKKFVARRVAEIGRLVGNDAWRHVTSSENIADVCSRGLSPKKAASDCAYLRGPKTLYSSDPQTDLHINDTVNINNVCLDYELVEQNVTCSNVSVKPVTVAENLNTDVPLYIQYIAKSSSDYLKCLKMISYRYRYVVSKLHTKGFKSSVVIESGPVTTSELDRAMLDIVRIAQESYYGKHNIDLIAQHDLSYAVKFAKPAECRDRLFELKALLPFYDSKVKILRVGGRIVNSSLPLESVHQFILPKSHFITSMIVNHEHVKSGHFGANYVLAMLMKRFWLCGGVATIRQCIAKCQYCKIRRAKTANQIMGDLPACRVTVPKFPFEHTGVDLFGPYKVKVGRCIVKRWGVLFLCMASRACYIDIVPDLSTNAFVQCFFRFTARRGLCCRFLYSDQGTNFKGSDAEFRSLMKTTKMTEPPAIDMTSVNGDVVKQCMLKKGIDVKWCFNVPKNPHSGGGWERAIKSVKHVFASIIYNGLDGLPALKTRTPTEYEFLTIMCEIEVILNCRPITKLSTDVNDWRVLTPISILTGNLHPDTPVHSFSKGDMYRSNYKYVCSVAEQFWQRWLLMYLPWLQLRSKWQEASPNLNKGDLVLFLESQTEGRRDYPKAIVVDVYADSHDRVRRIKLRLADGRTFDRDIRSVVPLEGCDVHE